MSSTTCVKCGNICEEFVWFGHDGEYCDDCVPRNVCYGCNYFTTEEEAKESGYENLVEEDEFYYAVDDNERLMPCVDYFKMMYL